MASNHSSAAVPSLAPKYILGIDSEMDEYVIRLIAPPLMIKICDGPEDEDAEDEGPDENDLVLAGDFGDRDEKSNPFDLQQYFIETFWLTPQGPQPMGVEKSTPVVKSAIDEAMAFFLEERKKME